MNRILRLPSALALGIAIAAATLAARDSAAPRLNLGRGNLAVKGYDVVAYFTAGRPVKGQPDIVFSWQGATWRFASTEHRDQFAASPAKYAPQFGGFCAWAVSRNYTADIDPDAWTIAGGRLFLNYSLQVREMWLRDRDGNIAKGDQNWPALSRKK